jgi:hypothetical protein
MGHGVSTWTDPKSKDGFLKAKIFGAKGQMAFSDTFQMAEQERIIRCSQSSCVQRFKVGQIHSEKFSEKVVSSARYSFAHVVPVDTRRGLLAQSGSF